MKPPTLPPGSIAAHVASLAREPAPPRQDGRMEKLTYRRDAAVLVRLLNEVAELTHRMLGVNDLWLHYRDGSGWRARLLSNPEGAKAWVTAPGPWAGLPAALRAEIAPLRQQLERNAQKTHRRKRVSRKRPHG